MLARDELLMTLMRLISHVLVFKNQKISLSLPLSLHSSRLLKIRSPPNTEKASVPIAPFHMYRAEQLLSDLAQQGFADAAQLLARLKTSTAREGGGEL